MNAGATLAVGLLPGAALGASFGLRLSPAERRYGVDVRGTYLPTRRAEVGDAAGGSFSLAAGALSGWWVPRRSRSVSLALGAGLELGNVTAVGHGFSPNRYAQSWIVSGVIQLELAWELSRALSLLLLPELGVPLRKDQFAGTLASGEHRVVFEPSPAFATLSVGLGFGP